MKNIAKFVVLSVLGLMVWSTADAVQPAPRWVQKGEKGIDKLNGMRSNDTYNFQMFQQSNEDETVIELNRMKPLLDYVGETYGVSSDAMTVDSLVLSNDALVYTVSFDNKGQQGVVYAQMIDEYTKYDTHVNGAFDYDNYQLYAISAPNVAPEYDNFNLTRSYNPATCTLMSLIPGMGQFHKGQNVRGSLLLGGEVLFMAGVAYGQLAMNDRLDRAQVEYEKGDYMKRDSYKSQADTYKRLRNVCLISGCVLYVYNLLDAALMPGARQVKVERNDAPNAELTFVPVVAPEMAGLGLTLRF